MNYLEFDFQVLPKIPGVEILVAELGMIGFESFVDTEKGTLAYIQEAEFNASDLQLVTLLSNPEFTISYSQKSIEQQNWNAAWESNFQPIWVSDHCVVRAPFHSLKEPVEFDLIIEPKMSFGTGHHETTGLMLEYLLEQDLNQKAVMDMGCGTGVLAIMAAKKGAMPVMAIDIDRWSYENTIENIERNSVEGIEVLEGGAECISGSYDVFIANINRNILIHDMEYYFKALKPEGTLLMSGFFETDIEQIANHAQQWGWQQRSFKEKNQWVAVEFRKA